MLRALGIIAEFNPFHNGHRRLIKIARQRTTAADVTVAVMSGNWTQRGQPAIVDKWQRTRMALKNGIGLVIELPSLWAVQPADRFAFNAMRLIGYLRCRWLAFGCEHPQWPFDRLASLKIPRDSIFFSNYRYSYADLERQFFYQQTGLRLTQPNDLLALDYARAKRQLRLPIQFVPVQRRGQHWQQRASRSRFASSTAIRRRLLLHRTVNHWVPSNCRNELKGPFIDWQRFWPLLRYQLLETSLSDLRRIYQMNEGLEFRFQRAALRAHDFTSFLQLVKTKRYTYSRLIRLCFYVLVKLTSPADNKIRSQPYLRILGFDNRGRRYLHQIKKKLKVPLIAVASRYYLQHDLKWELQAGLLIQMLTHHLEDLDRHPVIV